MVQEITDLRGRGSTSGGGSGSSRNISSSSSSDSSWYCGSCCDSASPTKFLAHFSSLTFREGEGRTSVESNHLRVNLLTPWLPATPS